MSNTTTKQEAQPVAPLTELLFEATGVGLCLVAPDGTVVRANKEWLRSAGFTSEQVVGQDIVELFPGSRDMAVALHARARAGHRVEVPLHAQLVLGRETWWEGSISPVEMEGGTGLLITAREDSSLVARGRKAAEVEAILHAIPHAVLFGGRNGIHRCNPAALRLFGASSLQDLQAHPGDIGKRFGVRYRQGGDPVQPEDLPFNRALAGETVTLDVWAAKGDSGEDVLIRASAAPVVVEGQIVGAVAVHMDITDQHRTEQALLAGEERLQSLIDCIPQLAWMARPDGYITWYNRRWYDYTGTTPQQMEGWGWQSVHDPAILPEVLRCWRNAIATGTSFDMEFPLRGAEGKFRRFLTRGVPLKNADGAVVQWFGTNTDVTELVEARESLRESDRYKTEFLALLSHELRNPLAPIRNSIYLLDRAAPGSEQASRAKDVLRRQTEHLSRLVDDLLDVTRISRGKIDLRRSRLDLRDIVRKTTDDFRSLFDRSEVELRVEHCAGPVWVDADATRLAQIVGNLLHNAVKFTPSHGTVVVVVGTGDGQAKISVRDSGVGMDSAQVERMFEPFAQGDHGLARSQGGLGLGLALVKGLVDLHGGSVRAHSDGLGRGTELIVTLSLAAAGPARPEDPRAVARAKGRLILIIEDNVDAGQSLADILTLEGHRVRMARDGGSGIELARAMRPDVVLCDIGLPGLDGYEVARALRGDDALRSTRLIALSGYAQPEDRNRAIEAGFDAHLAKPVALDELTKAIAEAPDPEAVRMP